MNAKNTVSQTFQIWADLRDEFEDTWQSLDNPYPKLKECENALYAYEAVCQTDYDWKLYDDQRSYLDGLIDWVNETQ